MEKYTAEELVDQFLQDLQDLKLSHIKQNKENYEIPKQKNIEIPKITYSSSPQTSPRTSPRTSSRTSRHTSSRPNSARSIYSSGSYCSTPSSPSSSDTEYTSCSCCAKKQATPRTSRRRIPTYSPFRRKQNTYRKKIHDPVSRFQQLQKIWNNDKFLRNSMHTQRRSLRWQVRVSTVLCC